MPSARRSAPSATRSAAGLSSPRSRDPYRRVGARQSPCKSTITAVSERASLRALSEDSVRLEVAELQRDAERQRREERWTVERRQLPGQMERAVASAAAGKHAVVDLGADRVPLARQARRQRQLDAPRHEQDARLHVTAIRRRVCSSSPKTTSGAYSATDAAAAPRNRSRSSSSAK